MLNSSGFLLVIAIYSYDQLFGDTKPAQGYLISELSDPLEERLRVKANVTVHFRKPLVGLAFPHYNASYRVPCQRGGCQWSGSFDGVHRLL